MLTDKQQIALDSLLDGSTDVVAARKAGVSKQLVGRWKKTPEFREALLAQQEKALDELF